MSSTQNDSQLVVNLAKISWQNGIKGLIRVHTFSAKIVCEGLLLVTVGVSPFYFYYFIIIIIILELPVKDIKV